MCEFVFGPLILLGLAGNVASFFTFRKMTHQNSVTLLFRMLAIVDGCLLLCLPLALLADSHATLFQVDGWLYTAVDELGPYIKVYIIPLTWIVMVADNWTHVALGMNRYIVVCRPLQAARLCTTSGAKKWMISVIVFSVAFGIPLFFHCKVNENTNGFGDVICTLLDNKWYFYIYRVGFYLIFGSVFPVGMLIFFYVRIVTTLRAMDRQTMDRHGNHPQGTRVTSMVLLILAVFLVQNIHSWILASLVIGLPDKFLIWTYHAVSCAEMLLILNSSVNWLIYVVYIKEFRRTVSERCCHCLNKRQVYELSSSHNAGRSGLMVNSWRKSTLQRNV